MPALSAYEARFIPAGQALDTPSDRHAVLLKHGSHLELPLRALPSGDKAIALLMTNQCHFAVEDALAPLMTELAAGFHADVIAAVPTMGLDYGRSVARGLGHPCYVALGHSRKFWYDEALSESTTSSTSTQGKKVFLDPALVERVQGQRVLLVDDVINTGVSAVSAIRLLQRAGAEVVGMVNVLSEGHAWRAVVNELGEGWEQRIRTLGHIPMFEADGEGRWTPIADTL
jgi:adenine/guanine phosphoribosyltransferase-like PRPP-binding protein